MFKKCFHFFIASRRREIPFIIFFSFLCTFAAARTIVHLIYAGYLPEYLFFHVNGIRIHHLAYGIFILAIAGFLALVDTQRKHLYKVTVLYGIGLGLAMDEFGMWIMLEDNYFDRINYDALTVTTALLLNIVYFGAFWQKLGGKLKQVFVRSTSKKNNKLHKPECKT